MSQLDESTLSDKVCKVLGTQRVYKEGLLYKRQRGLHSAKKLKFQERFCRLTQISLDYYDPSPRKRDTPKGQFAVDQIRIIESMPSPTFGKEYSHLFPFQIGDNSEIMYFSTRTLAEREEWLLAFRKAARDGGCRMLTHYHKGIFGYHLKGRWGCCGSQQRAAPGCSPVPTRQAPPMTPPPNRVSSILPEDLKPRAGTVADILLTVGGEGGGGLGGVGGVVGGEVGPGESPRIRSFTLVAPLRQKPDPKKLLENGSKRSTMELEYWEKEVEKEELLKRSEDLVNMKGTEPVVRQKSEEVASRQSNDLGELDKIAGELRGRKEEEEHREERASSPSPSDDSGKGTSTGSSRPSSQVISIDTEDGVKIVRSGSVGKTSMLSTHADHAGAGEAGSHRIMVDGDDSTPHINLERSAAGDPSKEGRSKLESSLKMAEDQVGRGRSYSGYRDGHSRPVTMIETEPVHLRVKTGISGSRSLENISKTSQYPPSPKVSQLFEFKRPSSPPYSNRTSKISTSSGSPQLRPRSIIMQSGGQPDTTLRRRRTIDEYSDLHRACRDGNVAALQDMLCTAQLADLEEPTYGAIPYTPLFLAFMNDHFQTMACLLEHAANPNGTEPLQRAPVLHWASARGSEDMVDLLLGYNADVNQKDNRGNTALWQACRNGHLDIVEKLLKYGAKVDTVGENHRTPLHEAASAGHATITELLIKEGANPCPRDNQEATPYDLAYSCGHKQVMRMLQQLIPESVRPYSLLQSHTLQTHQMVTSLVFRGNETLIAGSRDCHATFWDVSDLTLQRCVRMQDTVLQVGLCGDQVVISSTMITLNSLSDTNQRRIVADDVHEDESLTNPPLHLATFGPNGSLATAAVEGNTVKLWPPISPQTGLVMQPEASFAVGESKENEETGIIHSLSMSQSPDHPWVAVGLQPGTLFTPQGNKSVHLYNWKEKKLYQIFDAGSGGPSVTVHTAFSHDGRQLAVGCHENLCVWEPTTGDLLYKFTTTQKCAVTSLCYSPNGAHLAAGLASGEIQVFDIESNSCIFTLEPNTNPSPTCAVAYSEDGRLLAAGHRNGQIQIWEAYTGSSNS